MPTYERSIPIRASAEEVWNFVADVDNWASLFPGYQRHVQIEDDRFSWQIRGESGVWSRLVEFDVEVREWEPPRRVVFELTGRTEPVEGTGTFFVAEDGDTSTIGFELTAFGTGPTAPMLNSLLARFLEEESGRFLEKLAEQIGPATEGADTDEKPDDFPSGPGVIVVQYEAPRTTEFESWMHGPHYTDLLRQPAVTGVTRFERIGTTGRTGSYLALIHSEDLATTLAYRTTAGAAEMAKADQLGVIRGETYLARTVYDRRIGRLRSFLRRLRRHRATRRASGR